MITFCVFAVGSWTYAQNRGGYGCRGCKGVPAGRGMNYVDKDGDGICDNAGLRGAGKGRGQGCRFRAKNAAGTASNHGPNYVDKDGNGVCDNLELNNQNEE